MQQSNSSVQRFVHDLDSALQEIRRSTWLRQRLWASCADSPCAARLHIRLFSSCSLVLSRRKHVSADPVAQVHQGKQQWHLSRPRRSNKTCPCLPCKGLWWHGVCSMGTGHAKLARSAPGNLAGMASMSASTKLKHDEVLEAVKLSAREVTLPASDTLAKSVIVGLVKLAPAVSAVGVDHFWCIKSCGDSVYPIEASLAFESPLTDVSGAQGLWKVQDPQLLNRLREAASSASLQDHSQTPALLSMVSQGRGTKRPANRTRCFVYPSSPRSATPRRVPAARQVKLRREEEKLPSPSRALPPLSSPPVSPARKTTTCCRRRYCRKVRGILRTHLCPSCSMNEFRYQHATRRTRRLQCSPMPTSALPSGAQWTTSFPSAEIPQKLS